jgi:hypothetical protein
VDGEITDSRFHLWDLLSINNTDLRTQPYEIRYARLGLVFRGVDEVLRVCETAITPKAKRAFVKTMHETRAEGFVCKNRNAAYAGGRAGQHFKCKFVTTASFIVGPKPEKKAGDGHRSIALFLLDADRMRFMGTVGVPERYSLLWFAKTPTGRGINDLTAGVPPLVLVTPCHASIRHTFYWNDSSLLSLAAKSPPRKLGFTAAAFRSEAPPSATEPEHLRPGLLGSCSASLVRLEAVSPHRHSRNGRGLASSRFPSVLEVSFQDHEEAWQKTDLQEGSGSDLPHGRRPFS